MLLHIAAFQIDLDSQHRTPWHYLAPHTRLLCTLLTIFAIALTPNGQWWTWQIYGLGIVALILISRVSALALLKRVGIEFVFVFIVLLATLFQPGGKVVWSWGFLQITSVGLTVLGSVTFKLFLSLLILNTLVLTTSISALLQALAILKMPPLLVAIMASMYRYISVLIAEFTTMRRAAMARNLMATQSNTRLAIGNIIGSLFIRTYERGERVYQAMLARGYRGLPPIEKRFNLKKRDMLALILTAIGIVVGQGVYWL